jgi:hypothetical protein
VIELAGSRLHALSHPYALDGRVSWHPPGRRGFAPMNAYLLVEDRAAMLVDSGISVHRDGLLDDLHGLLASGTRLSVLHTRLGEYNSLCNTPAVAAAFDVETIYGPHVNAALWTDFEPHEALGFAPAVEATEVVVLGAEQVLDVGVAGERRLHVFSPVLRLLPTHWVYDHATRTLLTSDLFSHVSRATAGGPWIVTAADDDTTPAMVREHMLQTRYWWLPAAHTAGIARALRALFDRLDVERIAPGYGCVLEGRTVVERHVEMVLAVLA